MRRSQVAIDVLDMIKACFGDRCRDYKFARTRGIPPADCNSVTASWVDRNISTFEDCDLPGALCDQWAVAHTLRLAITNICMGPDGQPQFNWDLEDSAAACFDDDVDLLEQCIHCSDWQQLSLDHAISSMRYEGTTYDVETEGGGFSAYIELTLVGSECCSLS